MPNTKKTVWSCQGRIWNTNIPSHNKIARPIQSIRAVGGEVENAFVKDCCARSHVRQHSCYRGIPVRWFHSSVFSLLLLYLCVVLSHQLTPPWFSFHSRNHYCLFVCSTYKTLHVFFTYIISKYTCYGQAITEGSGLIGETAMRLCAADACWARPPTMGLWGLYGHMKYRSHLMFLWKIL